MSTRTSLNVSLTPELNRFVQKRVGSGKYQTASEVVREGLRLLEKQEAENAEILHSLKIKLERASDQADRNEFFDADHLFKKINALKRKRSRTKP